ncbi:hypothetical protein JOE44_002529 [Chryseobacterium sp. PvR013]|uniref:hypothetical protein n=1 Tax=Chryseobacterium sp. PvR013 TaxID=2806595 RepID=UPI001AE5D05D|nr:hypothetical protein [Chryseobacterium sp. PvR013]MBP1165645.1 hypothetical protein [Chryseobacterium sp. PvR013]
MRTVKLSLNKIIVLLIFFISFTVYSQKINLIFFINDELLTSPLDLEFYNKTSNDKYDFIYSPGKEIDINANPILKEDMILKFDAYGDRENLTKRYSYNIPLEAGLLKDTLFLIIKLYNLDKKEYRKRYCKAKASYVVEFHKSGLNINAARCK